MSSRISPFLRGGALVRATPRDYALALFDRVARWGALAAFAIFAVGGIRSDGLTPIVGLYAFTTLSLSGVGWLSDWIPPYARLWAYTEFFLALSFVAVLLFGPLPGTGMLIAASMVIAGLFLNRAAVLTVTLQVVLAIALASGVGGSLAFNDSFRILYTALVILLPMGLLIYEVRRQLESATEETRAALHRFQRESATCVRLSEELERGMAMEANAQLAARNVERAERVIQELIRENQALLSSGEVSEMVERRAGAIGRASANALRLLQRTGPLLKVGRRDDDICEVGVSFQAVMGMLLKALPPTFSLGAEIEAEGRIPVAAATFEHALLHLGYAARDAMPAGGDLHFSLRRAGERVELEVNGTPLSGFGEETESSGSDRLEWVSAVVSNAGGEIVIWDALSVHLSLPSGAAAPSPTVRPRRVAVLALEEIDRQLLSLALIRMGQEAIPCLTEADVHAARVAGAVALFAVHRRADRCRALRPPEVALPVVAVGEPLLDLPGCEAVAAVPWPPRPSQLAAALEALP